MKIGREIIGGRALLVVARAFDAGSLAAPDPGEIASQLGTVADDVSDVLGALKTAGLVVALGDGGLVPGRPLEKITLLDVRRALGGKEPPARAGAGLVPSILKEVEDDAAQRLAEITLRELCDRERGPTAREQPGAAPAANPAGSTPIRSA